MGSYITPESIAEQLGVTSKTVREWLRDGEIVGIKVGSSWRVHQSDFDRYIDGQRLDALVRRAKLKHPEDDWEVGQCVQCGEHMPKPAAPNRKTAWACTADCKAKYDKSWEQILGVGEDATYNFACVIPHF